jgi:hypothetical protein
VIKVGRRKFLNLSCSSILVASITAVPLLLTGNARTLAREANRSKARTKEEWMAQVLKQTRRRHVPGINPPRGLGLASPSRLLLGRFRDPWYYLIEPIYWIPNLDQRGHFERLEVPKGFVTDLASVPWYLWSALRPDGEYAYAAIVHDYLYWAQTRTRLMSDQILKSSMEDFHVDKRKIQAIYRAVRSFGESAWNENARLKAEGERRILKQFPPTAQINWAHPSRQEASSSRARRRSGFGRRRRGSGIWWVGFWDRAARLPDSRTRSRTHKSASLVRFRVNRTLSRASRNDRI